MAEVDLARFVAAQDSVYARVIEELRLAEKRTHWMWFIFPQIAGLGRSSTAQHFAIRDLSEASAYMDHRLLGPRLLECTETALSHSGRSAEAIFGTIDALKFRSSMTLFEAAGGPHVFGKALEQFAAGQRDPATLRLLDGAGSA